MIIDSLATSVGADIYYNPSFRNVIEDHLTYLRKHPQSQLISIKSIDAYKYEGDLFGLLYQNAISANLHWIVMRMNNFTSPTQTTAALEILQLPDASIIERIRSVFLTQNGIKS